MRQIVEIAEVQQQIAAGGGQPRNVEERDKDEIRGENRDRDRCQVWRIQAHVAFQQEARIVAKNITRAVEAPGNDESGDDEEDLDAKIAVFSGKAEIFSLPGDEVPPRDGKRRKGTKGIDDANSLLGVSYLHCSSW